MKIWSPLTLNLIKNFKTNIFLLFAMPFLLQNFCWALGFNEGSRADQDFIQNSIEANITRNYAPLIVTKANVYGVDKLAMFVVLQRQSFGYGADDSIQDLLATTGTLGGIGADTDQEALAFYWRARAQDQELAQCNLYHPVRNMRTHWLFASLGPAQTQVYLALQLLGIVNAVNHRARSGAPSDVARWISTNEGGIEILAAELKWIRDTFQRFCNVDLSSRYGLLWFLHNRGNVLVRAQRSAQDGCRLDGQGNLIVSGYTHGADSQYAEQIADTWRQRLAARQRSW